MLYYHYRMSLSTFTGIALLINIVNSADLAIVPTIEVESVFNKTRGSQIYPFACYSYPSLSTAPLKTWPAGTSQKFELNCWTHAIQSWKPPKGVTTPWVLSQFDNDIYWYHSDKEGCWFPDYVVQKDALYGPATGPLTPISKANAPPGAVIAPHVVRRFPTIEISSTISTSPPESTKAEETKGDPKQTSRGKGHRAPGAPSRGKGGAPFGGLGHPFGGPAAWATMLGELAKPQGAGPSPAEDLKTRIRYCPQPSFQTGTFKEQYNGQTYCYADTKLDSENKKITVNAAKTAELSCWRLGAAVEEDPLWWKLTSEYVNLTLQTLH